MVVRSKSEGSDVCMTSWRSYSRNTIWSYGMCLVVRSVQYRGVVRSRMIEVTVWYESVFRTSKGGNV